jgi:hypothetical protein
MNYYRLVQLADKVNNELDYIIEILKKDIQGESVESTISKLRKIQINAELLKDRLLGLNLNSNSDKHTTLATYNLIIEAEE